MGSSSTKSFLAILTKDIRADRSPTVPLETKDSPKESRAWQERRTSPSSVARRRRCSSWGVEAEEGDRGRGRTFISALGFGLEGEFGGRG